MIKIEPGSAKATYTKLKNRRTDYLNRAHECAKLTIPTLIPRPDDTPTKNSTVDVEQPWQSIGPYGVNTLTAKLTQAILPANAPFFQNVMGRQQREELLQLQGAEADQFAAELDAQLQKREQDVLEDMERSPLRTTIHNTLKHLLVAGNYLLFVDETPRGFPLHSYVCSRDGSGNALLMVVRELVSKEALPKGFIESLPQAAKDKADKANNEEDYELYTVVVRSSANRWSTWQEIFDTEVPGTRGTYKDTTLPWIPLRMTQVDGEDYGRSYVEELYGDLQSANDLSKAIVQGGLISSKLLWLVNPHGVTDDEDLMTAVNGDAIPGRLEDVTALRAEKMGDLTVAERTLQSVIMRLERAFLLMSSVQRDAERVTAFEISRMAQELDDTLGGYYSILAQELQLPLARRWIHMMERSGKLARVPEGSIEPVIVTGIDALGRGHDLNRLRGFLQDFAMLVEIAPEHVQRLKGGELTQRLANGHAVDITGLIKSDEEIAAEQQAAQQQAMMQDAVSKAAGPMAGAVASAATQQQGQ